MKTLWASAGLLAIVSGAESVSGAIVAQYDFTGNSLTSSVSYPSVAASNFLDGSPVSEIFIDGSPAPARGYSCGNTTIGGTTEAQAVAANYYFTATLTFAVPTTLTQINYTAIFQNVFPSTSVMGSWGVRSSLDAYASSLGNVSVIGNDGGPSGGTYAGAQSVRLDSATFSNLMGAVTFRFYLIDNLGSATRYIGYDNVTFIATDAVPEPTSLGLLAGVTGCAMLSRSRRQASRC